MDRDTKTALWTAGILFIVALFCYAAIPAKKPDPPLRIMLFNAGGNVLFDHQEHASPDAYGLACMDCHHMLEDPENRPESCGECHLSDSEDEPTRTDAFHQQCIGCHQEDGTAPVDDCAGCHLS